MEIRPIDANTLIEKLDDIHCVDYGSMSSYETHNGAKMALADALDLVNAAPTLSLNTLRDAIYQDAVEHGLWEAVDEAANRAASEVNDEYAEDVGNVIRRIKGSALVVNEAYELDSAYSYENEYIEELADVVIQAFSTAGFLGIDIDAAIRRKMEINHNRPWKHGKE